METVWCMMWLRFNKVQIAPVFTTVVPLTCLTLFKLICMSFQSKQRNPQNLPLIWSACKRRKTFYCHLLLIPLTTAQGPWEAITSFIYEGPNRLQMHACLINQGRLRSAQRALLGCWHVLRNERGGCDICWSLLKCVKSKLITHLKCPWVC